MKGQIFPVIIGAFLLVSCNSEPSNEAIQESAAKEDVLNWEKRPDGSVVALKERSGARCWPRDGGYRCILAVAFDTFEQAQPSDLDIAGEATFKYDTTIGRADLPSLPDRIDFPTKSPGNGEIFLSCDHDPRVLMETEAVWFRDKTVKISVRQLNREPDYQPSPLFEDEVNAYAAANSPNSPPPYFDCLPIARFIAEHGLEGLLLSDVSSAIARAE